MIIKNIIGIMGIIIIITGIFTLGWASNNLYKDIMNKRELNGIWLRGYKTEESAMSKAQEMDKIGDWICVNIKGMTIKEMIDTCKHESSHEIFAEYCVEDPIKCLELVGVKNETG